MATKEASTVDPEKLGKDAKLPEINDGEIVTIIELELVQDSTKPPSHYTEGVLIDDMKAAAKFVEDDPEFKKILKDISGLGTAATRDSIIEVLKSSKYVEEKTIGKSIYLVGTPKGHAFIEWLEDIMPEAVNVALTAKWEAELINISKTGDVSSFSKRINDYINLFIEQSKNKKPSTATIKDDTMADTNMPSDKQINFAKLIASKLGIRVPDEVMVDRAACSKFIEENSAKGLAPSEKQINFANSIAGRKKLTIPAETLANGKLLSAWIDANKD